VPVGRPRISFCKYGRKKASPTWDFWAAIAPGGLLGSTVISSAAWLDPAGVAGDKVAAPMPAKLVEKAAAKNRIPNQAAAWMILIGPSCLTVYRINQNAAKTILLAVRGQAPQMRDQVHLDLA
jgi:hypothetical protein